MFQSLWARFFTLLLAVSLIALSAAVYLRHVMVVDFRQYLEGEYLDQVYRITAELEGIYEAAGGWERGPLVGSTVRALMHGVQVRVFKEPGRVLMDTATALEDLPPFMERRVLSIVGESLPEVSSPYASYPLFLGGRQIGVLEARPLAGDRSALFIERSNKFLLLSFLIMGGIAVLASLLVSRRLTSPLKKLMEQTRAIRRGDLARRTVVSTGDEIGQLSVAFNEMAEDLQLQESLRRKLIANVAHELRTPLAAMRGELEGIMDGVLPLSLDQVRSLHEETGRLESLLDGIDDLTQAQASSLSLQKREVDLGEILVSIGERFAKPAEAKGVHLVVDIGSSGRVLGDPDRLTQIVINLVSNALRATPRGGTVTLATVEGDRGGAIEVRDTGSGIEEKDLPFIFERFYRGRGGGLGLGLTIVRELVDAHGGSIEVQSEPGRGTTVRVKLPDKESAARGQGKG